MGRSCLSFFRFFTACSTIVLFRTVTEMVYFRLNPIDELQVRSRYENFTATETIRHSSLGTNDSTFLRSLENNDRCRNDNHFQYNIDFERGDLDERVFNRSVRSAAECCKQCDELALCTHWTYNSIKSSCSLKNSPATVKGKQNVVSGRVSLDKFVLRRRVRITVSKTVCSWEAGDSQSINNMSLNSSHAAQKRPTSYIVINEPRSGSSWFQEVSQMHPGIKVQFELDMEKGDDALACKQCKRPAPDSKNPRRLPPKLHPPLACGMTIFGSNNKFDKVAALARRHNASLVLVLRRNHVAHVISSYRHFNTPKTKPGTPKPDIMVPWGPQQMMQNALEAQEAYRRLLQFPTATGRPAHIIFYEDLKRNPDEVWHRLQLFLGLPPVAVANISTLEAKSSSKPSIHYLRDLPNVQRALNGTEWHGMVTNPRYDDELSFADEFAAICAWAPAADISWREQRCAAGRALRFTDLEAALQSHSASVGAPAPSLRNLNLPKEHFRLAGLFSPRARRRI